MAERTGSEVAVVGCGIVGLASAVYLQRAGAKVTAFDPLPPAAAPPSAMPAS